MSVRMITDENVRGPVSTPKTAQHVAVAVMSFFGRCRLVCKSVLAVRQHAPAHALELFRESCMGDIATNPIILPPAACASANVLTKSCQLLRSRRPGLRFHLGRSRRMFKPKKRQKAANCPPALRQPARKNSSGRARAASRERWTSSPIGAIRA